MNYTQMQEFPVVQISVQAFYNFSYFSVTHKLLYYLHLVTKETKPILFRKERLQVYLLCSLHQEV